jgi:hypothetical protein
MRKLLMIMLLWTSSASASVQPAEAESPAIHPASMPEQPVEGVCSNGNEARPLLLFVRSDDGRLHLVGIVRVIRPDC